MAGSCSGCRERRSALTTVAPMRCASARYTHSQTGWSRASVRRAASAATVSSSCLRTGMSDIQARAARATPVRSPPVPARHPSRARRPALRQRLHRRRGGPEFVAMTAVAVLADQHFRPGLFASTGLFPQAALAEAVDDAEEGNGIGRLRLADRERNDGAGSAACLPPALTSIPGGEDAVLSSCHQGSSLGFERVLLDNHGIRDDVAALVQIVDADKVVVESGTGTARAKVLLGSSTGSRIRPLPPRCSKA